MDYVIERLTDDKLERQIWEFSPFIEMMSNKIKLIIRRYVEEERKTTRHKFQVKHRRIYEGNRLNSSDMNKEDVPMPIDVVNEVKTFIKNCIDNAEIS